MNRQSHHNQPPHQMELNMRSPRYSHVSLASHLNHSQHQVMQFLQLVEGFVQGQTEFCFFTEVVFLQGNDYKSQFLKVRARLEPDCVQLDFPPSCIKGKLTLKAGYNTVVHQFHFRENGPLIIAPTMPKNTADAYVVFVHPPSALKTIESELARCLEPSQTPMATEPTKNEITPAVTTWNFMDE